jgi:hypothetical protein
MPFLVLVHCTTKLLPSGCVSRPAGFLPKDKHTVLLPSMQTVGKSLDGQPKDFHESPEAR